MPKHDIDYSNTIFYKISCKDEDIKELYIGHTTNFVQRKYSHKRSCISEKNANHNLKVYKCIRDNGGWNNWKMDIIGFHECYDHYEARKIEQKYFESLNATLNSIEPLPKPRSRPLLSKEIKENHPWNCNICDTICQTEKQFLIHQESNKHKRNLDDKSNRQKSPKVANKFNCEVCDFKCCKQSDFSRHLLTRKHKMFTNDDNKTPKNAEFICDDCGKCYKYRQSLYVHKKKCKHVENEIVVKNDNVDYKGLLFRAMDQLQQQQTEMTTQRKELIEELRKKDELMEQMIHKVGHTTNNNTTNNNQFNINMFLNETCKNAVNFSDFIERIEISHDDLENNAQLGFVNGMTKILIDNLRQLTLHERPIHCTDVKRETFYIKDQDVWDKETSTMKLENAIQEVSRKSLKSLINWKKTNPDYDDMDSEFSKRCIHIQQHSSAICEKSLKYPKIIHNIAKENTIVKH